ncbi:MAG: signal peptidase I [Xanthobacteraceae bacterium]
MLVLCLVLLMSLFSYYLTNRYFLSTVIVQGRSMSPTLRDGDRYLLNRLTYVYRVPKRGDLVVLHDPGHDDLAVKRIVGLPGEAIQLKDGQIYVNGRCLSERYLVSGTQTITPRARDNFFHLRSNQYFVLGDNRDESEDSRFYGPVIKESIIGALIH